MPRKKYNISRFIDREYAVKRTIVYLHQLNSKLLASFSISFEFEVYLSDISKKTDTLYVKIYNSEYTKDTDRILFAEYTSKISDKEREKLYLTIENSLID